MNRNVFIPLAVASVLCVPGDAHAYLDPGTGSMVLQAIIAGVLGLVFTFKSYLRAILSRLRFTKNSNPESDK
jgi:hypothetical protein